MDRRRKSWVQEVRRYVIVHRRCTYKSNVQKRRRRSITTDMRIPANRRRIVTGSLLSKQCTAHGMKPGAHYEAGAQSYQGTH